MDSGYQFISKILDEKYIIPKYQRGYRWSAENVTKLLEDIFEDRLFTGKSGAVDEEDAGVTFRNIAFNQNETNIPKIEFPKSPYCIQPLVVMPHKKNGNVIYDKEGKVESYDVIDGQQRLTTISLICAALNEVCLIKDIKKTNIEYESRTDSECYLQSFYDQSKYNKKEDYIDYLYMNQAFKTAKKFFKEKLDKFNENEDIKKPYAKYLYQVICHNTQFIWYEPKEGMDPQKVFAHFNTGKIELTNAELIKALFMNPANYTNGSTVSGDLKNLITAKQINIAEKWDEIERMFHDRDFWAFMPHPNQFNENAEDFSTRIDVLFEFLVMNLESPPKKAENYIKSRAKDTSDKYIFNKIDEWIKNQQRNKSAEKAIEDCWRNLTDIYSGFKELFADEKMYNVVGLYTYICNLDDTKVHGLSEDKYIYLSVYATLRAVLNQPKDVRLGFIKNKLKDEVFGNKEIAEYIKEVKYKDNKPSNIIKMLLFYNVALSCNARNTKEKFNFVQNTEYKWEREHIFAENTNIDSITDKQKLNILKSLSTDSYVEYVKYLFDIKENYTITNGDGKAETKTPEEILNITDDTKKEYTKQNRNGFEKLESVIGIRENAEKLLAEYKHDKVEKLKSILSSEAEDSVLRFCEYRQTYSDFEYEIEISDEDIKNQFQKEKNFIICDFELKYTSKYDKQTTSEWLKFLKDEDVGYYSKIRDEVKEQYKEKLNSAVNELDQIQDELDPIIISTLNLNIDFLKKDIDKYFKEKFVNNLNDNHMGNFTLLTGGSKNKDSSGQNQRVSDSIYKEKRKIIMDGYKAGEFFHQGTLLVFTDAHTDADVLNEFWLPDSRYSYLKFMIGTIEKFFNVRR